MLVPIDIPGGLNSDDTAFASSPAWTDSDGFRFVEGRPQAKGGWESVIATALTGVCRSVLPWTDNIATLNLGFGTNSKLALYQGGSLFDITPASGFTAGAVDGAGSAGFGTGAFGIGGFGSPSATDYFPLTWSQAAWGQTLLACPRGQSIFQWSNNTANKAVTVTNAPANVTYMLVAPTRQVFALGCSQESGGVFNPLCIRHSSIADETTWATDATSASTAREYVLPGGGRIVGGRVMGRYLLVWTSQRLFLGTYFGQIGKVWSFDPVPGNGCGLIGPNAAVVIGSTAFWISPDRQFHTYTLGGAVSDIPCPIRKDFADNLAASQGDKIVASTVSEYSEIRWDYPDSRDGFENSRYVSICIAAPDLGKWHRGRMVRTAMVDAGPSSYPCGVIFAGNIYWHERGQSADGAPLSGFIETAESYLDENSNMLVRGFWPDFKDQRGALSLILKYRRKPQGVTRTQGPVVIMPGAELIDLRADGRLFRLRLEYSSSPAYVRIGRLDFDAVRTSGR